MFLDTVNPNLLNGKHVAAAGAEPVYARWQQFPHTTIVHHGSACCETAREWFLAMDFSQLAGGSMLSGPRWIRARYEWGPSKHPIHWCEAVNRKTLDCGVLAAMANECFTARGVRSYPAQLVQRYSTEATKHWADKWTADENTSTHWIKDDVIYHEGCAVISPDGSTRLWDASAAWWINPLQQTGYGSLAAVRIIAKNAGPDSVFRWGTHTIQPGQWHII
jgi:hypothetical protein